jgi:ferrous iron transport protein B
VSDTPKEIATQESPPILEGERLDRLPVGGRAVVLGVLAEGGMRQRLLELGLVPGVEIQVIRIAPMGDPIEVLFRNSIFSLNREEAATVVISKAPAGMRAVPKTPMALRAATAAQLAAHPAADNGRVANGDHPLRIAVAGNPNTGKTTLFNVLTGLRGRVGNFPGVTVERLVGRMKLGDGRSATVIDIPGTESLNARSRDEQVAMSELLGLAGEPPPDAVVVVLNANTLERSMYLLLQIQELGIPTLAVVNMADEAEEDGVVIHYDRLAEHLAMPVVRAVARRGEGVEEIRGVLCSLLDPARREPTGGWHWSPGEDLARHLDEIVPAVTEALGPDAPLDRKRAFALWCLMSLGERDDFLGIPDALRQKTLDVRRSMGAHGHDLALEVTQARYSHVDTDSLLYIDRSQSKDHGLSRTERIDRVLTHPVWGLLIFIATIALLFATLMDGAAPLMEWVEGGVAWFGAGVRHVLPAGVGTELLVGGVITGVGSVLVFLPQILVLFFFLTLLEASGYLARAAFLMDRLMRKLGLPGKAFVPMLSGFACAIPAIMATRTLESRRDRIITIMVIPLLSCSARLPIYTLVIAALFPSEYKALGFIGVGTVIMIGLYFTSAFVAFAAIGVLRRFVLRGEPQRQILELPPYRMPEWRSVFRVLWQRGALFLRTAGTVILVASVVLWTLLTFPRLDETGIDAQGEQVAATLDVAEDAGDEDFASARALEHSIAGRIGRFIEPAIAPLGFDWKIGIGLIGAFAAREVFISTMGLVYGMGEDATPTTLSVTMREQRRADGTPAFTPLRGVALLVFFLLAMQCFPTLAVVRQETASWRWPLFQLTYMSGLAYVATLVVYQLGTLMGF